MPVQNLLEPSIRPAVPRLAAIHTGFVGQARAALAEQRAIYHYPTAAAERVFADILRESGDTEFGPTHRLASVRTLADWRKAIPVRQYEDIAAYVDRIRNGRRKVLTASRPYAFLKTSGSSGVPKHAKTLADAAQERGVVYSVGTFYDPLQSGRYADYFRIAYAAAERTHLQAGLSRLAETIGALSS